MSVDSKLLQLLETLGLNTTESATYLALLQIEDVSIRKVAAHTGVNRGTTYESLKRLVTAGLVSVHRRGQREYYTAESPEKIYDIIRDHRRDLLDARETAKVVVPALLARHRRPQGRPVVRYYEGDEGIVTILKDVLETCQNLPDPRYFCYSSKRVRQYIYRRFPRFTERRIAAGIRVQVISVGEGGERAEGAERKWLSGPSAHDASSYTLIYGNKVAVISISSDLAPYGVVVEDEGATSMQRLLFSQLWDYL